MVTSNPEFRWTPVPEASKYRIEVSTSPSFASTVYKADVLTTTATPTAELPLASLYWHVASIDSSGTVGVFSEARSLSRSQPAAPTPTAPADGTVLEYPTEPPVLSWSAVPGMKSYSVEIDDADDFNQSSKFSTNSTSFSLPTSIPSETARYWRVQGVSTAAGVTTEWSPARSFAVIWPDTARPVLVTPVDDLDTAIDDFTFSWTKVPGAASYVLETSTNNTFTANVETYTTYATQYRPTETLPQDQYFWRVRAVDPSGNAADWSDVSAFKREWLEAPWADTPRLEARPTLELTDADSAPGVQLAKDRISISWTPVRQAAYYELEVSKDPSFLSTDPNVLRRCKTPNTTWTPYLEGDYTGTTGFTPCAWTGTSTSSSSTKFITENGGPYYVRVRAVDTTTGGGAITTLWSNAARPGEGSAPTPVTFTVVPSTATTTAADEPASPIGSPDSTGTPKLTWSPVEGAEAYLVALSLDSSFNTRELAAGSYIVTPQTELVINEVLLDNTVGEPYHWFALPCSSWSSSSSRTCSVGEAQAINRVGRFATFSKLGKAVAGLSNDPVQTDTVALSWDDQLLTSPDGGGIKHYKVEVRDASNAVVDTVTTDATGYTPRAKSYPDGPYTWRVLAVDAAGRELELSGQKAFEKRSAAPLPHDDADSPVRLPVLRWDATAFAKSYHVEVYRGADPAFPLGSRVLQLTTTYPVATPSATLPAGDYSWRVRQVDSAGRSGPWSTAVPQFTVGTVPPALTAPIAGAATPTRDLVFRWSTVAEAVQYRLETSTTEGFGTAYDTVTTVGTAYVPVKPYVGGTTYFWRVTVLDPTGAPIGTTEPIRFTAQTTPSKPSASATVDGTTVAVSWTEPATGGSPITGYQVRYRSFGSTEWTYLDRAADTRSVAFTGLAQNTKYEAQVAAVNAIGISDFSATVSATTPTTPDAPASLKVTPGISTLAVSWSAPKDGGSKILGYVVRFAPVGGATSVVEVAGTSTTLSGLTAGTSYNVDVAARNAVGQGPFATSVPGTPNSATSPTPTTSPTSTSRPTTPTASASGTTLSIGGGKTVIYGGAAALAGILKTSSGAGVGSAPIAVQSRAVGGATWASAGTATTSSSGAWSLSVKPTENREFRAVFAGSGPNQPSTSGTVKVLVAPKVITKLSARKVKLGKKVVFSGAIKPVHKASKVHLQRLQGKKWVTKKSVKTSSTSTYRFVWKTDSKTDFYWRVLIPAHGDHVKSYSTARKLTVQ